MTLILGLAATNFLQSLRLNRYHDELNRVESELLDLATVTEECGIDVPWLTILPPIVIDLDGPKPELVDPPAI